MNLKPNNATAAFLLSVLLLRCASAEEGPKRKDAYHRHRTAASDATRKKDLAETRRVWVRYDDHDACLRSIETASLKVDDASTSHPSKMKVEFDFPHTNSVVITASEAGIQALMSDPNVKDVVDDPKRYFTDSPHAVDHDRRRRELLDWPDQATSYGLDLVQAREVWEEAGLRGAGVTVCVIDTGFDLTHEDFNSANFTGESLLPSYEWLEDGVGHGKLLRSAIAHCAVFEWRKINPKLFDLQQLVILNQQEHT